MDQRCRSQDNHRSRVLSHEEETALLEAALNDSNSYSWLFVKIGLSSSLRHGEILSARFDGFDPNRRRLRVRVKGGRIREQPLSSGLCHKLDCVTDYAQRSIPSGSRAGDNVPCRESLITAVSMFGG